MVKKPMEFKWLGFSEERPLFTIDGKPCYSLRYNSKQTKQYAGYKTIENDLTSCIEVLYFLQSNQLSIRLQAALKKSVLILYGRCFSQTDGARPRLGKDIIPKKYISTHNQVIEQRHKMAAHSLPGEFAIESVLALYPNKQKKSILAVAPPMPLTISPLNENIIKSLNKLLPILVDKIKRKKEIIYKKIVDDIYKIGPNELYKYVDESAPDLNPVFSADKYEGFFLKMTGDGCCIVSLNKAKGKI